jgi:hypothetical protein
MRRLLPDVHGGVLEPLRPPAPDFGIRGTRYGFLGVEVTEVCHSDGSDPLSEQSQTGKRDRIVADAQRHFLTAYGGNQKYLADIIFNPWHPLSSHHGRTLPRLISQCVHFHSDNLTLDGYCEIGAEQWSEMPEEVALITITDLGDLGVGVAWTAGAEGGHLPHLTEERVSAEIMEKAKLLSGYRAHCESVWLLLSLGLRYRSMWQWHDHELRRVDCADFDRVILVQDHRIQVLTTQR